MRGLGEQLAGPDRDGCTREDHAIAEQLAWGAENNPAAVGLSHAAFVRFRKEGLAQR